MTYAKKRNFSRGLCLCFLAFTTINIVNYSMSNKMDKKLKTLAQLLSERGLRKEAEQAYSLVKLSGPEHDAWNQTHYAREKGVESSVVSWDGGWGQSLDFKWVPDKKDLLWTTWSRMSWFSIAEYEIPSGFSPTEWQTKVLKHLSGKVNEWRKDEENTEEVRVLEEKKKDKERKAAQKAAAENKCLAYHIRVV